MPMMDTGKIVVLLFAVLLAAPAQAQPPPDRDPSAGASAPKFYPIQKPAPLQTRLQDIADTIARRLSREEMQRPEFRQLILDQLGSHHLLLPSYSASAAGVAGIFEYLLDSRLDIRTTHGRDHTYVHLPSTPLSDSARNDINAYWQVMAAVNDHFDRPAPAGRPPFLEIDAGEVETLTRRLGRVETQIRDRIARGEISHFEFRRLVFEQLIDQAILTGRFADGNARISGYIEWALIDRLVLQGHPGLRSDYYAFKTTPLSRTAREDMGAYQRLVETVAKQMENRSKEGPDFEKAIRDRVISAVAFETPPERIDELTGRLTGKFIDRQKGFRPLRTYPLTVPLEEIETALRSIPAPGT